MTDSKRLLPVGTRIRFIKSLYGAATGDSPACVYAKKGDGGVVTGHGTPEGHWVKWDKWPHAFGAEYAVEFITEANYFYTAQGAYLDAGGVA
jgi:hypothetical protein